MLPGDPERSDLLLLSGGMDSVAIAAWLRPKFALTIDYGQRSANAEIEAASQIALDLGISHRVLHIDCSPIGSGDLAGKAAHSVAPASDWWPFRNQLLITFAAGHALTVGARRVLIGSVANDSYHSDGSPDFLKTMNTLLRLQEGGIELLAPAIEMTALDLIRVSEISLSLLAWAHSCHKSNFACGLCRGCNKHRETWDQLTHGPH